ncbi:type I-F CRISPR-associated protein Csy1 [Laribacter hongkongensis]|uniref:type I-F CRISPR-associated protein Csy1 n=1 Tax=Laribacter hongkongensis TaxID=168471 RepID=UPI001EFC9C63|nr:type I-F CRISPR-associated protein Csy1 [Laribacter hongkongensis]MCG9058910.1 type I-F CRISPR-associated protein Csy1 [Laribacter hongkongensis]MCG9085025.1 type I-F CRISPR-associated protein Csy1 [Laribacter hongkongensis]
MSEQTPRSKALAALIAEFIHGRLEDKLEALDKSREKLGEDQERFGELVAKRDALLAQYQPAAWLEDAARRVSQLQLVTHPLKATHPDARGSSLFVAPDSLPVRQEVGTHALADIASDVVGNAAALDVYKFLKLEHEGQSLLALLQAGDADVLAALSDDAAQAEVWREAFCSITEPAGGPASHSLAKQVYWPVSPDEFPPDALDDSHFHLLSVLNSSALSHWLFGQIQAHRKAAWQARRDGVDHPHGYHDYPLLAEEKKGGTKPQNISQLNSERKGSNYLLASLPPLWDSSATRPLYGVDSLFERFGRLPQVRRLVRELRDYLGKQKPEANNMHIKNRRDAWLEDIFTELLQFGAAFSNGLPKGWTADSDCRLLLDEQCWLDPFRAEDDADFNQAFQWQDWPDQLAERFARWLNGSLGAERLAKHQLSLNEAEFDYWRRELAHDLAWQRDLDSKRRELDNRLLPTASTEGVHYEPA